MLNTIATIIGARPQFIKSSPLSNRIDDCSKINELIIDTGQHFDINMSKIFYDEMKLSKPKYNLNINQHDREKMIDKMVVEIEQILIKEKIRAVLVYGDTNSTVAGAISASKLNIPIFHIESGLRSYNRSMPEEINRIVTDHLSSLLFCPTDTAVSNLEKEDIKDGVILSGDVMLDCYLNFSKNINDQHKNISSTKYILATIHRRENLKSIKRLTTIFSNLNKLNDKIRIVMPLHPHTKNIIKKFKIKSKIDFIEPLGYPSLIKVLNNCELVITDSGGLQKEAFFAKKKCLTVRTETEWTELIKNKANMLCEPESIISKLELLKRQECDFSNHIYGNGRSSEIILDTIKSYLL